MFPAQPSSPTPRDPKIEEDIVRCRNRVLAANLRIGSIEADAEDAAQEAALRLTEWPGATSRPRGRWLRDLAAQCIGRVLRARIQAESIHGQEIEAKEAQDQGRLDRIWLAVDRLPAREARVLRLLWEDRLTPREVATRLGMRSDEVHLRYHRARLRLRKYLSREGE